MTTPTTTTTTTDTTDTEATMNPTTTTTNTITPCGVEGCRVCTTTTTALAEEAALREVEAMIAKAEAALAAPTEPEVEVDDEDETVKCPSCDGEHHPDDSCDHCYYCEECEESHDPDTDSICESCFGARGRRHRVVCSDRCNRCFYCEGCGERHHGEITSQCSRCDQCTDNHDCVWCGSCQEYTDPDAYCSQCDQCGDCGCVCHPNCPITLVENPVRFVPGKRVAAMPSTRLISFEFEIAKADTGHNTDRVVDEWEASVVEDGSVSDGVEVRTTPASGDKVIEQIRALGAAFAKDRAEPDNRCGLHVHIDARDFRWRDHGKLLWLYAHMEAELFGLVPRSRRGSHWCEERRGEIASHLGLPTVAARGWSSDAWKSRIAAIGAKARNPSERPGRPMLGDHYCYIACEWGRCEHTAADESRGANCEYNRGREREIYERAMNHYNEAMARYAAATRRNLHPAIDPKGLKRTRPCRKGKHGYAGVAAGTRYYALNLQSLFKHGTIECRLHHGTVEADKALAWGALWAAILDYAKKSSIEQVVADCDLPPRALLERLTPAHWREFFAARREKLNR